MPAQESPRVLGQLIVQAKSSNELKLVIDQLGFVNGHETKLKIESELSPIMHAWLLSFDEANVSATEIIRELNRKNAISIVQFNHLVNLRSTIPGDPNFGSQWHHVNDGTGTATEDADIDSDLAWDITTGGLTAFNDSIVVCVVEGGNLAHTDLQANAWKNLGEIPNNDVDDDLNGFVDDYLGWNVQSNSDQGLFGDSHGTQVSGMIGAKGDNNLLVSGINWNVKIMVVGGENANDEASVIEAYNYPLVMRKLYNETDGAQGAFVVATNASWGIDYGDPLTIPIWCAFYDTLGTYGILNCGATANAEINVDEDGDIPTGCTSPYMISVTATNNQDVRTFSAYGLTAIDLGAPGENVVTTSGDSGSGSTSGTSFASPLTAGVIGLLYSAPCNTFMQIVKADPQAGADLVRNALLNGVDVIDDLIGYTVTGGRLNAYNSLIQIINNCGENVCLGGFNFEVEQSEDSLVNLSWGVLNDSNVYNIRYKLTSDAIWTELNNVSGTSYFEGTQEYRKYEGISLQYCANYDFQLAATCDTNFTGNVSSLTYQSTGCCSAPSQLSVGSISTTSAMINWQGVSAASTYELEYKEASEADYTQVLPFSENNYLLEGLSGCTPYEVRIKSICADSAGANYSTLNFNTKGCEACDSVYCISVGNNSSGEFIQAVQIGDFVNQSGNNGGYISFINSGFVVNKESNYSIKLTPGFSGSHYNEYFSCWIDFNQNGQFEEEELTFEEALELEDFVDGNIVIPSTASMGITKMRIVMKYFTSVVSAESCEAEFDFGEVEDYCIEIIQAVGLEINQNIVDAAIIYPNPVNNSLNITANNILGSNENKIFIYDASGRLLNSSLIFEGENRIDFSQYAEGLYTYQIKRDANFVQKGSFSKIK